jgi:MFS family permease
MYVPFYVQGVQGESATISGLVEMVMTISMVTSSIIVGNLITKTGKYKLFALIGLVIMSVGLILNTTLEVESSLTRLILQLIVVGIGLGVNMPVFNITVQNAVSHKYLGVATSAMQTFRQIGGTVGVALLGSVMGNKMTDELANIQNSDVHDPPPEMAEDMAKLQNPQVLMDTKQLEGIRSELPAEMTPFFDQFIQVLKHALNTSLTTVFLVSAGIIAIAFVTTLFLKEIPLRTTNNDEDDEKEKELVQTGNH